MQHIAIYVFFFFLLLYNLKYLYRFKKDFSVFMTSLKTTKDKENLNGINNISNVIIFLS